MRSCNHVSECRVMATLPLRKTKVSIYAVSRVQSYASMAIYKIRVLVIASNHHYYALITNSVQQTDV